MQQVADARPMERLRVLSANLWVDRVDPEGFGAVLDRIQPDVVCIQELHRDAARALESRYPHGLMAPTIDPMGMGIALRNPAKLTELDFPHKIGLSAVLEPDDWEVLDESIEIVNMHFAAPGPKRPLHHLKARRQQIQAFEAWLEEASPSRRLLVGDMNATPLWPLYWRLSRRFTDAHRRLARRHGHLPRRTWGPTPRWPRLLRIDHVFTDGVGVCDVWVVRIPGTDHSGLVIDVERHVSNQEPPRGRSAQR